MRRTVGFALGVIASAIISAAVNELKAADECVTAVVAEYCFDVQALERIVDPVKLRLSLEGAISRQSKLRQKNKVPVVAHPEQARVKRQWNKIVKEVLKPSLERKEFYKRISAGETMAMWTLVESDLRPVIRFENMPTAPVMRIDLPALAEFAMISLEPFLSKFPPEQAATIRDQMKKTLVEPKISQLPNATTDPRSLSGISIQALAIEFTYQLQRIHYDRIKDVIFFDESKLNNITSVSPYVDKFGDVHLPLRYYNNLSETEKKLTLFHEAMHFTFPDAQFLLNALRAVSSDLSTEAASTLTSPLLADQLKKFAPDNEPFVDANVLRFLLGDENARIQYAALIRRVEPGPSRGRLIQFLNQKIAEGAWPPAKTFLTKSYLADLFKAYIDAMTTGRGEIRSRIKNLAPELPGEPAPRDEARLAELITVTEQMVLAMPTKDRAMNKKIMSLLIDYIQEDKRYRAWSSERTKNFRITERNYLKSMLGTMFQGVVDNWNKSK